MHPEGGRIIGQPPVAHPVRFPAPEPGLRRVRGAGSRAAGHDASAPARPPQAFELQGAPTPGEQGAFRAMKPPGGGNTPYPYSPSSVRTRCWPTARSSVGSRGPVSRPTSSSYSSAKNVRWAVLISAGSSFGVASAGKPACTFGTP
ncbi:hypothetical protein QFZ64_003959 [Streptomyces sp. B3I8]|nr:hypothetical protein [Streptomyces sp. B3I8]